MIATLVINTKGGCGKTTIATHLAAAFSNGGLRTALAEKDRQKSSLQWLQQRPASAASIASLDWRKRIEGRDAGAARLVIDSPAGMRSAQVDQLVRECDVVVVPVLPSSFDEFSTLRFLSRLRKIKPVRKERVTVLVVANRVRARSRSASRLFERLESEGYPPVASIHDRAIYGELAAKGLALFDLESRRNRAARADWLPLIQRIESV